MFENSRKTFRRARNAGELLSDLPPTESGVDEDPDFGGFEIGAVSAGTAAKNREVNRHGARIIFLRQRANVFLIL